jgi:hypothetical protein
MSHWLQLLNQESGTQPTKKQGKEGTIRLWREKRPNFRLEQYCLILGGLEVMKDLRSQQQKMGHAEGRMGGGGTGCVQQVRARINACILLSERRWWQLG